MPQRYFASVLISAFLFCGCQERINMENQAHSLPPRNTEPELPSQAHSLPPKSETPIDSVEEKEGLEFEAAMRHLPKNQARSLPPANEKMKLNEPQGSDKSVKKAFVIKENDEGVLTKKLSKPNEEKNTKDAPNEKKPE